MNELDSLLGELGGIPNVEEAAPSTIDTLETAPVPAPQVSELDGLLGELEPAVETDITPEPIPEPDVDEGPGRLQSAFGNFLQGGGRIFSSIPKSAAIGRQKEARNIVNTIDELEAGRIPTAGVSRSAGAIIQNFQLMKEAEAAGDAEAADYLRGLIQGERDGASKLIQEDPKESPLFKAGDDFDTLIQEAVATNPKFQEEFITSKVPQGLGSMVSFVAAAAVGRGTLLRTGLGPTAATALPVAASGGVVQYVDGFEDALNNGADFEVALESAERNTALGFTEAIPIAQLFNRLDKGSGGLIKRGFKNALKSGTEEAIQESFQQVMSNAIAQDLYDPTRGTWTGTADGASVGFTTGAIVSFLGTMISGRRGRVDLSDIPELTEDERVEIVGPQQPIEQQQLHVLKKRLLEEAAGLDEGTNLTTNEVRTVKGDTLAATQQPSKGRNTKLIPLVRKELQVETPTGTSSLGEAMAANESTSDVYIASSNHYERQATEARLAHEFISTTPFNTVEDIQQAELDAERANNLVVSATEIERESAAIVKSWNDQFASGLNTIISVDGLNALLVSKINRVPKIAGSPTIGGSATPLGKNLVGINLNVDILTDEKGIKIPGMVQNLLTHEYGHALVGVTLAEQPQVVQKAVLDGWKQWVNSVTTPDANGKFKSYKEYNARRKGAFRAQNINKLYTEQAGKDFTKKPLNSKEIRTMLGKAAQTYEFGFSEYVADTLVTSDAKVKQTPTYKQYFGKVHEVLKRFHSRFIGERKGQQSFDNYLNYLATDNAFNIVHKELKDIQSGVNSEVATKRVNDTMVNIFKNVEVKGNGPDGGVPNGAYTSDNFKGDNDKFNKAMELGYTLLQVTRANPHIQGLQNYTNTINQWWNMKMRWTEKADERLVQWKKLKPKRGKRLGNFLLDLTVESFQKGKELLPDSVEFQRIAAKWDMDAEMMAVYTNVAADMQDTLTAMEEAMIKNARYTHREDDAVRGEAIQEIQAEVKQLRARNFFPLSRFGQYYMTTKADHAQSVDGVAYQPGDTISFETFEDQKTQKKAVAKARKDGVIILHGKMTDDQRQFAGLPPQFLKMLETRLELTPDQQEAFQELQKDIAPGQSFLKHLKHRKNTKGFSGDAMRGYANYFFHFSNHIARVHYKGELLTGIDQVKATEGVLSAQTEGAEKRTNLRSYMQEHLEYMLNPGNELSNLRALGFIWYLGFMPKSAVVNLTQVPLITYPFLAARYGDAQAVKALTKGMKDATLYWKQPWRLKPGQISMLEELKANGIIDESMATELAAVSEGSMVQRLAPTPFLKSEKAASFIRNAAGKAAWMFQQAEKANRRIAALAAYELAQKAGKSHVESVKAASVAVDSTQYEYARFNRPKFMRGKKSVFFLFWQYKQHTLHFLFNDPGNVRFMMVLLGMAGASGLPFAEDIFDFLDFLGKKYNKLLGKEAAPVNIRKDIRAIVAEMGANPDLMMHGAARYSFGAPALADMVGVPLPNVDMSGSLSFGRVIPGAQSALGGGSDFEKNFARGAQEALGPVASVPIELVRALTDDNPNTLKKFERAMPSIAKSVSKAYRYATDQLEQTNGGDPLAEFDLQDTRHIMEIIGQAGGFAPTRLNEAKEKYYMTKELAEYYNLRRTHLMNVLDFAQRTDDDGMADKVLDAIGKFNDSVPVRTFAISPKQVLQSRKNRERKRALAGEGIFTPESHVDLQFAVDEAFPNVNIGGGVVEEVVQEEGEPSSLDSLLKDIQ